LDQLKALDAIWDDGRQRQDRIECCRKWMALQIQLPRLAMLAGLLTPEMSRRQLWSVLVPVERAVTRLRITDVDILDSDLTAGATQGSRMPVTVVVDSLRSAFNVGGILRTAECFGFEEVILCGYSPLPDQAQVARAALGADQLVNWSYAENIRNVIRGLTESGVCCYALETVEGAVSIMDAAWHYPAALILGNERFGLDPDIVKLCRSTVRIELYGAKNSLNVVSAFAVAASQMRLGWKGTLRLPEKWCLACSTIKA
jgi:tRNA(Leu) C34 or U34 (ribose-2'-O)-methylase TrmL